MRDRSDHSDHWLGFWFGVGEALLLPLAFAALGLAWWGVERAEALAGPYPRAMHEPMHERRAEGELWLVDGYNVVQVALLADRDRSGWWTSTYRDELMARLRGFDALAGEASSAAAPEGGPRVWVAFDGSHTPPDPDPAPSALRAIFAPSADEWLLARVREAPDPARVRVVTADRRLASRARHHRAVVVSPRVLLDRCGGAAEASPDRGRKAPI